MASSLEVEVSWFAGYSPYIVYVDDEMFSISSSSDGRELSGLLGQFPESRYQWFPRIATSRSTTDPTQVKLAITFIRDASGAGEAKSGTLQIFGDNRYERTGDLIFSIKKKN